MTITVITANHCNPTRIFGSSGRSFFPADFASGFASRLDLDLGDVDGDLADAEDASLAPLRLRMVGLISSCRGIGVGVRIEEGI